MRYYCITEKEIMNYMCRMQRIMISMFSDSQLSQSNGNISRAVSLSNYTFTGQD